VLEYLLSVPSLVTYGRLRFTPELRRLHGHPRYQKLLDRAAKPLPLPPP
jgi:hypothetical protein